MSFDKNAFRSTLSSVFTKNGFSSMLSAEKAEKFLTLTEILLRENEKYNLTAITEPDKIILAHYADCAAIAKALPYGVHVCDVGCGAGFPTLPIAILRPDLKITGMDSTAKRTSYVDMAARELSLDNVSVITARAEDAGRSELRESFDVVTARAVAAMRILTELCLPLVKCGGHMIAMKGKNADFELNEAKRAIATLGGKIISVTDVTLKSDNEELCHPLITVEKQKKTPIAYPRAYAQISKKPL